MDTTTEWAKKLLLWEARVSLWEQYEEVPDMETIESDILNHLTP